MRPRFNTVALVTTILLCFSVGSLASTIDTKGEIKVRMKERFAALQELKKEDKIGETYLGLVEPLSEKIAKNEKIMKTVNAENADRSMLYEIIAKENKTKPELVGRANALRIFKKAKPNAFFKRGEKEIWKKKKDFKKEFN